MSALKLLAELLNVNVDKKSKKGDILQALELNDEEGEHSCCWGFGALATWDSKVLDVARDKIEEARSNLEVAQRELNSHEPEVNHDLQHQPLLTLEERLEIDGREFKRTVGVRLQAKLDSEKRLASEAQNALFGAASEEGNAGPNQWANALRQQMQQYNAIPAHVLGELTQQNNINNDEQRAQPRLFENENENGTPYYYEDEYQNQPHHARSYYNHPYRDGFSSHELADGRKARELEEAKRKALLVGFSSGEDEEDETSTDNDDEKETHDDAFIISDDDNDFRYNKEAIDNRFWEDEWEKEGDDDDWE